MVKLRQDDRGNYSARKRLPDDVREEYKSLYGARFEAKFSMPATVGHRIATEKFREWEADVSQRISNIRATQRGEGIDLSRKDAAALAGEWYSWFIAQHEDAPGDPEAYETALWDIIEAIRDFVPDDVRDRPFTMDLARDPEVREGIRPVIADLGHTAQFLAHRGVTLTKAAHTLFLDFVLDNYVPALLLLERRAKGDFEPDELPKSFPAFTPGDNARATGQTPSELFELWIKAREPAQSTIESWRTVFNTLTQDFPNRRTSTITHDEAQAWLDGLVTEGRAARTVRNTWLRATRTVCNWGAKKKKLTSNPFAEVAVDVPRRKSYRPKSFYEHERTTILSAACAITDTTDPEVAARRWVPWLLAYTGARPGEITQLCGENVEFIEGIWTLNLTPEAGTIKGGIARRVPLHDHIKEQGFLEFVRARGDGPLFYRPRRNKNTSATPTRQRKSPGAQTRQRLAAWVRELGVNDEHVSPNHAWRHTFKLIGRRVDPDGTILDYICGHAPATTGREYGEPELKDMARVIDNFPRYKIE
jgi:integrase